MKTFPFLFPNALLLQLLVFPLQLLAEKSDSFSQSLEILPVAKDDKMDNHRVPHSRLPQFEGGGEQIEMLRRLLDTPPEKLRFMRETIQRVEKMSPEDREEIRRRLKRFRELPQHRRNEVFRKYHNKQNSLRKYWSGLPPQKREREMLEFQRLPPHERKAFVDRVLNRSDRSKKPPVPLHGPHRGVPEHRPPPPPR